MKSRDGLVSALVVLLLLVSACGAASEPTGTTSSSGEPGPSVSTELQRAQQLWTNAGPAAYRMTLVASCGERPGLGVFRVTVTPGGTELVVVDYNSDFGYPEQIDVDYWVDAIDDEACYTVKNFEPLGLVD